MPLGLGRGMAHVVRIAHLDGEVPAFQIAELAEALAERGDKTGGRGRRTTLDDPDAGGVSLLGPRREPGGEEKENNGCPTG
jgi:hypothetical protein